MRRLFEGGVYSRAAFIRGNTVLKPCSSGGHNFVVGIWNLEYRGVLETSISAHERMLESIYGKRGVHGVSESLFQSCFIGCQNHYFSHA